MNRLTVVPNWFRNQQQPRDGSLTRDVEMRSNHASHEDSFPLLLSLLADGELVPTLESPRLESTHLSSSIFKEVTSC